MCTPTQVDCTPEHARTHTRARTHTHTKAQTRCFSHSFTHSLNIFQSVQHNIVPVLSYEIFTHCYISDNNTQHCKWHKVCSVREDSWFCSSQFAYEYVWALHVLSHYFFHILHVCFKLWEWTYNLMHNSHIIPHSSSIAGVQYTIHLDTNSLLLLIFCTSEPNITTVCTLKPYEEMDNAESLRLVCY
jgi:hypothetical protein